MEHTPRPWQAIQQCANSISVLDKDGREICSILSPEDDYVTQQCIDNAKLISCAPELLEALIAAKEHLDFIGWGDSYERESTSQLEEQIESAIKKAK
jgi:hypothetical protein